MLVPFCSCTHPYDHFRCSISIQLKQLQEENRLRVDKTRNVLYCCTDSRFFDFLWQQPFTKTAPLFLCLFNLQLSDRTTSMIMSGSLKIFNSTKHVLLVRTDSIVDSYDTDRARDQSWRTFVFLYDEYAHGSTITMLTFYLFPYLCPVTFVISIFWKVYLHLLHVFVSKIVVSFYSILTWMKKSVFSKQEIIFIFYRELHVVAWPFP